MFRRKTFAEDLLASFAKARITKDLEDERNFEKAVDRQVDRVLFESRWWSTVEPLRRWFRSFSGLMQSLWRMTGGRYWKSSSQIHSGATQTPGGAYVGAFFSGPVSFSGTGTYSNAVADEPIENAGIRTGEVIAYRCWILREDGFLYSAYQGHVIWKPDEPVKGDPSLSNEGVHGFKDRLSACQYIDGWEDGIATSPVVSGTVHLWGQIVEHERGYRAEFAAIKSIDDSPNYDAEALRKLYGC